VDFHFLLVFSISCFGANQQTQKARADSSPDPSSARTKCKNKLVSVLPNPNPQKIVLAKPSPHFAPPHCPNAWRAEHQKEKCPFHFRKNHLRENTKSKELFSFWGCRVKRGGGGAIRRAYDLVSLHHALRACHIICFENRF